MPMNTPGECLARITRSVDHLRPDLKEAPEVQFAALNATSIAYSLERGNVQLAFTCSLLMAGTLEGLLKNIEDESLNIAVESLQFTFDKLGEALWREHGEAGTGIKKVAMEELGLLREAIEGGWEVEK